MYSLGIFGSCVAKIFFAPISHTELCSSPSFVITSKVMPAGSAGVRDAGGAAPGPPEAGPDDDGPDDDGPDDDGPDDDDSLDVGEPRLRFFADMGEPRVGDERRELLLPSLFPRVL